MATCSYIDADKFNFFLRMTIFQVTKFFHRIKDLYVPTFLLSIELNSLLLFFVLPLSFFGMFLKRFFRFACAKFRSWCDYKLAIIKP